MQAYDPVSQRPSTSLMVSPLTPTSKIRVGNGGGSLGHSWWLSCHSLTQSETFSKDPIEPESGSNGRDGNVDDRGLSENVSETIQVGEPQMYSKSHTRVDTETNCCRQAQFTLPFRMLRPDIKPLHSTIRLGEPQAHIGGRTSEGIECLNHMASTIFASLFSAALLTTSSRIWIPA